MQNSRFKLFKSPSGFYFYDVNKNRIVRIAESSYGYLKAEQGKRNSDLSVPPEIDDLRLKGFLDTRPIVKTIHHPMSDYLGELLNRKLNMVTLQVTQKCNFRCKYCVYSDEGYKDQRTHSQKMMSWEVARRSVDFLLEHSVDNSRVNIGFYGGEPLLAYSLVRRVIEYAKKRFVGKVLSFSITCNGSLLEPEIISFLNENSVNLMISLDGPEEINDLNRIFANGEGTYRSVLAKLDLVRSIAPDYFKKIKISTVIDPCQDFDCFNSITVDHVGVMPDSIHAALVERSDNLSEDAIDSYTWKFHYHKFLSILSEFNLFPKNRVSRIPNQLIESFRNEAGWIGNGSVLRELDCPSGPCVPGQLRLLVDVNGNFFPCERIDEAPSLSIGSLDAGFDIPSAQKMLNIAKITEQECINCWAFRYCTQCVKRAGNPNLEISKASRLADCASVKHGVGLKFMQYILFKELTIEYQEQIIGSA